MKYVIYFLFGTFLLISLNSCETAKRATDSNSGNTLYSYQWQLTELGGKPFFAGGPEAAYLIFENLNPIKVYGTTGCNRLNGTVLSSSGNSIKFSPLATTRMACQGDNESRFLDAINRTDNWKVSGNNLMIYNGDVLLAKFKGVSKELAASLDGTWNLNFLSGLRIAFDGLYPDKKPHVVFNLATEEMSGNSSCNLFTSKYTMDGNKITFQDALKTMMYCEGGGEEAFFNMLKKVNHYSVKDNILTFFIDDVAVMRFTKS
jgi:heat shock protein HslJ